MKSLRLLITLSTLIGLASPLLRADDKPKDKAAESCTAMECCRKKDKDGKASCASEGKSCCCDDGKADKETKPEAKK